MYPSGFPLPYLNSYDAEEVRFVAGWMAMVIDAVVVYGVVWLFRRFFAVKLTGRGRYAFEFRWTLYYGIYSTSMCFVFMFVDSQSGGGLVELLAPLLFTFIMPASFFYPTLLFMDDWFHWTSGEEIIAARLLLVPIFIAYVFLFDWLAVGVSKIMVRWRARRAP
jgi:hypothetical protein